MATDEIEKYIKSLIENWDPFKDHYNKLLFIFLKWTISDVRNNFLAFCSVNQNLTMVFISLCSTLTAQFRLWPNNYIKCDRKSTQNIFHAVTSLGKADIIPSWPQYGTYFPTFQFQIHKRKKKHVSSSNAHSESYTLNPKMFLRRGNV